MASRVYLQFLFDKQTFTFTKDPKTCNVMNLHKDVPYHTLAVLILQFWGHLNNEWCTSINQNIITQAHLVFVCL